MALTKSKITKKAPAAARTKPSNRSVKRSHKPRAKAAKTAQIDVPKSVRPNTKKAVLIEHLRQPDGATIAELVSATGWQPHSVRGAISGTLKKKLGLAVTSDKVDGQARVYRISA